MQEILITITNWLQASPAAALPAAFLWGMVAIVLSPCHLASIPLFIAYVAGQKVIPAPKQAARYAFLFALGLFITIMVVGLACAALGRMLGDVGPWWQAAVGILLLYFSWTLFRPAKCSAAGSAISRFRMQGSLGALILGLGYGFLSGACTFGFIAPILGVITLQKEIVTGVAMLVLFGLGLCLPLVICGIFSARTMKLLYSNSGQMVVRAARRGAAFIIFLLGIYFTLKPFWP